MIEEELTPNLHSPSGDLLRLAFGLKYPYEIEEGDSENIDAVKEIQWKALREHGRQLPMIIYSNHAGSNGPGVSSHFTTIHLNEITSGLVIPISEHYIHSGEYPEYEKAVALGKRIDIYYSEIVQSYRMRNMSLTEEEQKKLNSLSVKLGRQFNEELPTHLEYGHTYLIMPEGHRSETILPAEAGVGKIVETAAQLIEEGKVPDALVLPLGVLSDTSKALFGRSKSTLRVGEPVSVQRIIQLGKELAERYGVRYRSSVLAHALMYHLTTLLPEELHGVYAASHSEEFKRDLLEGKITTGINEEKKFVLRNSRNNTEELL